MDFFGFTIKRRTDELEKQLDSFVADKSDDGAVVSARSCFQRFHDRDCRDERAGT